MDVKRITYGGLAAALVMIIGELVAEPLFGANTERFFSRLGLPVPGEGAMVTLVLTLIVLGWITVCLYEEFAHRSGLGAKTAAQTGVLVWALSCFLPNITLYSFGVSDTQFFIFTSVWPLVETVVAAIAGAAVHDAGRARQAVRTG